MKLNEVGDILRYERDRRLMYENVNVPLDQYSEDRQCAVIKGNWRAINDIKRPSEKVQMCAVSGSGKALAEIIQKGIVPSEEVMRVALFNDGSQLYFVNSRKVPISDELVIVALRNRPETIKYVTDEQLVGLRGKLDEELLSRILSDPSLIKMHRSHNKEYYDNIVRELYYGNELMQRKWIRRGDRVRNEIK